MDSSDPRTAPIAIVGMSCRLSGDVRTPDDFWTLLCRSRDGFSPVPANRLSAHAYYHPNPQKGGTFNQEGGYFMHEDFSKFDAPFFNVTKQEATAMDPQQRQLLETTYEALENAGMPLTSVAGKRFGVFVGARASDYRIGTLRDLNQVPMFDATGNHQSIQAGRISYFFDLRGPSFAVDTACSSSLYALHAAVQSLRSGESESAIVTGCNLNLQPDDIISMSMLGIFNKYGKTFAFDHRAKSGFARGEGVGCLILKPLDQAIRDNDRIRSVIVNTGTNQDGRTIGISTPNGAAQEQLIRDVYARVGASPADTAFIEAHGTGTKVGDPIEATALYNVFGNGRTKKSPLYMGSVKTNIGHLENVSGIMSVLKASMMLEYSLMPPNVNFEKANDAIPLEKWNMKVPTTLRAWPRDKKYISVNNFGFSGSNAHCILEAAPRTLADCVPGATDSSNVLSSKLIVLSGNDEVAAKKVAVQLGTYIEQHPEVFQQRLLTDMAYTLCERRTHFPWRIALAASTCSELAGMLNGIQAAANRAPGKAPKMAFVYTGQGAQWPEMGKALLDSHPIFYDTMKSCSDYLTSIGAEFSLLEELCKPKEKSKVNQAHISQPICTAVQLGLTNLLSSWGIKPSAVVGHSSGELGAAYSTGGINKEDAMAAAYFRGQAALRLKATEPDHRGAMLAVGAGASEIKKMIETMHIDNVAVACENSPNSITASGDAAAIDRLAAELEAQGVFNRKLCVDVAYHSSRMVRVADYYLSEIKTVVAKNTEGVAFYSSLMGHKLENTSALGPQYWVNNLTRPVLFSSSLQDLYLQEKPDIIVEIGPHSALEGAIKQILKGIGDTASTGVKYFPSLVRNKTATTTCQQLAGSLFVQGQIVNFNAVNQSSTGTQKAKLLTDFAPYPFTEHKYWFETRSSKQHRLKPFARHDLLGLLDDFSADTEPVWRNVISSDDVPWLKDHRMQSLATFPLAGYLCMAVEAASQRSQLQGVQKDQITGFRLREIQVSKAFILDEGSQYETMVTLRPYAEGTRSYSSDWDEFQISSWTSSRGWLEHCRGLVGTRKDANANTVCKSQLKNANARRTQMQGYASEKLALSQFYRELSDLGAGYNSVFTLSQNSNLCVQGTCSASNVRVPETASCMPHSYELPSLLPTAFTDLFFQLTFAIIGAGRGKMHSLYMPSAIKEVEVSSNVPNWQGSEVQVVASTDADVGKSGPIDFIIEAWHASQPEPVVAMNGFRMTPVHGDPAETDSPRPLCYSLKWEPIPHAKRQEHANSCTDRHAETNDVTNGVNGIEPVPVAKTINGSDRLANGHPNGVSGVKSHSNGYFNEIKLSNGTGHTNVVNGPTSAHTNGVNGHTSGHTNGTNGVNGNTNGANGSHGPGYLDGSKIVIITKSSVQTELLTALMDSVHLKTGTPPSVATFDNVQMTLSTRYISIAEIESPLLLDMKQETFDRVKTLLLSCTSLLWVTSGSYRFAENPQGNIAQGLFRTVRSEQGKPAATMDLDPNSELKPADQVELILQALKHSLETPEDGSPVDYEFAEDEGKLVVPRFVEQDDMNVALFRETQTWAPYLQKWDQGDRRLKIEVGTFGTLDSLYWADEPVQPLNSEEIEIKVEATGMNFKDVVIAMGQVASPYLGVECSGIVARVGDTVSNVKAGDRVCAVSLGAYSTYARCPSTSVAVIPDSMSFETAASIPVVYSTAYYGMLELARIEPGEKILIHAASGGIGQAAIQLAKMVGAEVFATVGSDYKKELLIKEYGIAEDHIFYSRDTSFRPLLKEATGGKGVDVVINSLAGDLLRESWECLAPFGRFIEIGKRDITSNTRLEMCKFEYNCSFHSVDLTLLADQRPKIMGRVLTSVMKLLADCTLEPIGPITAVGLSEVESALRKLQSGKTVGKVVVKHSPSDEIKATHPMAKSLTMDRNASYIIIGGTGGLGRYIAKRLVECGAGHIVLLSRSGKMNAELETSEQFKALGGTIHVHKCDAASAADVSQLVGSLQTALPPIKGVIHAAMVLKDMLFESMTFDDYEAVVRSKVSGAWNFHEALSQTPLDFFIVLSSVAGIVGNRGQAAYAAANTFLDAFALFRRRKGLKATSLDLTGVVDVGYLAENSTKQAQVLNTLSGATMVGDEVLALIESAIDGQVASICNNQCVTGLNLNNANDFPFYASDGKFVYLREAALAKIADADGGSGSANMRLSDQIRQAAAMDAAQEIVTVGLRDKLGSILMLPPEAMEAQQATTSITSFGLDSLNAIELRNWIGKELHAHLQVLELLTSGSLGDLAGLVLKKTRLVGAWPTA